MTLKIEEEKTSPLSEENLFTAKLKALSESVVDRYPFLRDRTVEDTNPMQQGVWLEIDDFDQKIIGKIKIREESIVQLEQRRSFLHEESSFELVFQMLPSNESQEKVFNITVIQDKADPSGVATHDPVFIYRKAHSDLAGIIRRTETGLPEEDLGIARFPDELDAKILIERVVAGEFVLEGIWNPAGEIEKR